MTYIFSINKVLMRTKITTTAILVRIVKKNIAYLLNKYSNTGKHSQYRE